MRNYRGITIHDNTWRYGSLHVDDDGGCWIIVGSYAHKETIGCCFVPVYPETVGQQVGITDKNEKESYQNDKVKFEYTVFYSPDPTGGPSLIKGEGIIDFIKGSFMINPVKRNPIPLHYANLSFEIIGNKHEKEIK